MPPRATWTGHLRLSLVSLPIRLYNATTSSGRVSFNQLHKECNRRLKQQMVCPECGAVERADIVKGYEFEKDKYVVVQESDLAAVKLETTKVIEVFQFADAGEFDPMYLDSPYYVAPDGAIAEEAFHVIREAMRLSNRIGLARVVLSNRERICSLAALDKGLLLTTLRYSAEVRGPSAYFEDLRAPNINKDQLKMAQQLIDGITGEVDMSAFNDRYEDAMLAMIKGKIDGSEPVVSHEVETGQVINLMDALKKSVASVKKKPPAPSIKTAAKKSGKRARSA
jgi:DNA end-binding protein Ku